MDSSRTISELKTVFLRHQIRVLSATLEPSEDWRDYGPEFEDGLTDKAVADVAQKVNILLKRHNRAVFSTQAVHHVARQIENLYWKSVDSSGEEAVSSKMLEKGVDLTDPANIGRLPERFPIEGADEELRTRYETLRYRLKQVDIERKETLQKAAQYAQLQKLVEPFKNPKTNIQPNLVTRDGQLGAELDRMRVLLAKVGSRIGELKVLASPVEEQYRMLDPKAKLDAVLDLT